MSGEWSAGNGNLPANSSSVEFRGFGFVQLGRLRARGNPQIGKFLIRFRQLPSGRARQSLDALPAFPLGAEPQLPAMPGSVANHRNSPPTDAR
jgi:hypothetical protein